MPVPLSRALFASGPVPLIIPPVSVRFPWLSKPAPLTVKIWPSATLMLVSFSTPLEAVKLAPQIYSALVEQSAVEQAAL